MTDPILLHGYVDGELTPAERADVERALQADPTLRAQVEAIRAQKQALTTKCVAPESHEAWQKVRSRLSEMERTTRVESFFARHAWALAGVFFIAILVGGIANRGADNTVRTGDVARYVSSMIPMPSSRSTPADAQQIMRETLGVQEELVDLDSVTVLGVAQGTQAGRKVAMVKLLDSRGPSALLVVPGTTSIQGAEPIGDGYYAGRIEDMNMVAWVDGNAALILCCDRPVEEIRALAQRICIR